MKTSNEDSPPLERAMVGWASGKAILLGEHAVVHGAPALVAGLPDCMTARDGGEAKALSVQVLPWRLSAEARAEGDLAARALTALDQALADEDIAPAARARRVLVESKVPPRAGLGSSAALAISVGRLIARLAGREDLLSPGMSRSLAEGSETIFHGTPSGVDAAAAAAGGIGTFARSLGLTHVDHPGAVNLVLAMSGERPPAHAMVGFVSDLVRKDRGARRTISRLGELTGAGAFHLARDDQPALGAAMDEAHSLLSSLGVSTDSLDSLVRDCRRGGAYGAKLTGAGGGGCIVALCSSESAAGLLSMLRARTSWSEHFTIQPTGCVRSNGRPGTFE